MKRRDVGTHTLFGFADVFAYILVILVAFLLLFSGNARKEPHKVPIHPRNVTVATGKAYTDKPFSPQLAEGIRRICVTASHRAAAL